MTSQYIKQVCDLLVPVEEPTVRLNVKDLKENKKQISLRSLVSSRDFLMEFKLKQLEN